MRHAKRGTVMSEDSKHRNDTYGEVDRRADGEPGVAAPIPAATVVLLRDVDTGPEVLMLRKNTGMAFGGMWVFPGGRIDAGDFAGGRDTDGAARAAAAREAREEAGLELEPDAFVWFSHWTPPPGPQKRFATWFFAAGADAVQTVTIDDGEIGAHEWIAPQTALDRHAAGAIDIVPPTWVTLWQLARHARVGDLLAHLGGRPARHYATRIAKGRDGHRVTLWEGDAGYASHDADAPGARHRLVMAPTGFRFEYDAVDY
jgi:8-oxo-dGTP pyrophosphatase MutT (NUDIX family)